MIDQFDDLGTAKAPYKVVACIPVLGRLPLLEQTIKRLYRKNDVYKVICVGHGNEERNVCEDAGAVWVQHRNRPLGDKWNAGFIEAKQFNPDACLYVGSSDFVSYNWIDRMAPFVRQHHLVGVPGMFLVDVANEIRLCYWPGYDPKVRNESIGIGRMLSGELLDSIGWAPFKPFLEKSLDRSMIETCATKHVKEFILHTQEIRALSISTNQWPNKHRFEQHWSGDLPSQRIEGHHAFLGKNFPEVYEIFKTHPRPIPQ